MVSPLDPIHTRETLEKTSFSLPANSSKLIFYKDNEDGWITEVFVYANGNLTLDISLGSSKESMKISDAYTYGLRYPNTTFWNPVYDVSGSKYAIAYHPFNPQSYRGSVNVTLKNESSSAITVTRVIFRRIVEKVVVPTQKVEPSQEFPPYEVSL